MKRKKKTNSSESSLVKERWMLQSRWTYFMRKVTQDSSAFLVFFGSLRELLKTPVIFVSDIWLLFMCFYILVILVSPLFPITHRLPFLFFVSDRTFSFLCSTIFLLTPKTLVDDAIPCPVGIGCGSTDCSRAV